MKINNINNFANYNNYNIQNKTPDLQQSNPNNKQYQLLANRGFFSSIKLSFARYKMPVYVINENRECKKFASQKEAADYIGCDFTSISQVLRGHNKTIKGYAVLKA